METETKEFILIKKYPNNIREQLREIGAIWNSELRCYILDKLKSKELDNIVEGKLTYEDYIPKWNKEGEVKAIVVRGNSFKHKDSLKELGGSYNYQIKGWIFAKNKEDEIKAFIEYANK